MIMYPATGAFNQNVAPDLHRKTNKPGRLPRMAPQADSLDTLPTFDRSLRLEWELARIVVRDDGRSLTLVPARGSRLSLTYKPTALRFEFSSLQGTSYIAYRSEKLPTKNILAQWTLMMQQSTSWSS